MTIGSSEDLRSAAGTGFLPLFSVNPSTPDLRLFQEAAWTYGGVRTATPASATSTAELFNFVYRRFQRLTAYKRDRTG